MAGVTLLAAGFVAERTWHSLPGAHALETLSLAVLTLGLAALLRKFLRIRLADALLGVFAIALLCFAGPLPVLATLLMAALGLGSAIAQQRGGSVVAAWWQ